MTAPIIYKGWIKFGMHKTAYGQNWLVSKINFRLSGLGGMKPNTLVLTMDDSYRKCSSYSKFTLEYKIFIQ